MAIGLLFLHTHASAIAIIAVFFFPVLGIFYFVQQLLFPTRLVLSPAGLAWG
jgi:hypothetical protein